MSIIAAADGLSGAGKTTTIRLLSRRFRTLGMSFKRNSIGDVPWSKELTAAAKRLPLGSPERASMFFQLRMSQFMIAETESRSYDVIMMDRFMGSLFAYNVNDEPSSQRALELAKKIIWPKIDLVLFFDLPFDVARLRKESATTVNAGYAQRLEQRYHQIAAEQGWVTIDATQPLEKVADDCFRLIIYKFEQKKLSNLKIEK